MGMDPLLEAVKKNVVDMKNTYGMMQTVLGTYDQKLVQVLGQHENDFIYAYKTHMYKIERELKHLK